MQRGYTRRGIASSGTRLKETALANHIRQAFRRHPQETEDETQARDMRHLAPSLKQIVGVPYMGGQMCCLRELPPSAMSLARTPADLALAPIPPHKDYARPKRRR